MGCILPQFAPKDETRAGSGERISHVERLEFPEVAVIGIERADAVLKKDSCDVGVRDEVPPDRYVARHVLVSVHEAVQLRDGAHMRKTEQRGNIPESFGRRERRREDAWMSGDAQIRRQRRPCQTEYFRAGGARLDKAA